MLDPRRMQVLRAVISSGSMSAAATNLGYTPSAISQQVATLEREAGTPLLEKAGRGVRPTPAGALLAERAGALAELLNETETALADVRAGRTGRLRVGFFQSASVALIPPAVAKFRAQRPDVQLELDVMETDVVENVAQGRADLGIFVVGRDVPQARGVRVIHLLDEPYRITLPSGHPLCAEECVDLAQLSGESWVHGGLSPGPCAESLLDAFASAGFTPRVALEADSPYSAQGFVAAGLGVALLPRLGLDVVHPGVVIRPVRRPEPVRRLYIAVRESVAERPATLTLLSTLFEIAGAGPVPPLPGTDAQE
jgi:DNA-binding transcriptional LysR family regulator